MHTAILTTESQSQLEQIMEFAKSINLKARIVSDEELEDITFNFASESALQDWLSPEEDEAWKNL